MQIKVSTRVVFLTQRWAIKIPIDRRGWLQGLNERKLWAKYRSRMLVPIHWSLGGIVIQPRVEQNTPPTKETIKRIKSEIEELDVKNCDLYNVANWGQWMGRPVLLDYGITEQVSQMY